MIIAAPFAVIPGQREKSALVTRRKQGLSVFYLPHIGVVLHSMAPDVLVARQLVDIDALWLTLCYGKDPYS